MKMEMQSRLWIAVIILLSVGALSPRSSAVHSKTKVVSLLYELQISF